MPDRSCVRPLPPRLVGSGRDALNTLLLFRSCLPDGFFLPSRAPPLVGSGRDALNTLLHEGGHAAHMANIDQPSPLFGQERAPFSVAMAETQSMFLDSYGHDAAWLGRYARSAAGESAPIGHPMLAAH